MVPTVVKRCRKCGSEKPIEDFSRNKLTRDGRASWCKTCTSAATAAYQKTSRGKQALKQGLKKQQDKGYFRFGRGAIYILRQGALARGLTFTLTPESLGNWWRETPDICAYCGITTAEFIRLRDYVNAYAGSDYEITKFRRVFRSSKQAAIRWLTLDRVDNARGYELDNLVKCCWFCNYIKGSLLTHADMLLVGKSVIERLRTRIAAD
jgi:hypothetical protein